jgi:hypothetical protein
MVSQINRQIACAESLIVSSRENGHNLNEASLIVAGDISLSRYAAQHWVDHAQFGKVSARIRDTWTKPHFAAWLWVHDIDEHWVLVCVQSPILRGVPLYYVALPVCALYDLAEHLIVEYPDSEQGRSTTDSTDGGSAWATSSGTDMARTFIFETTRSELNYMQLRGGPHGLGGVAA